MYLWVIMPVWRKFRSRGMFLVEFLVCSCIAIVACSLVIASASALFRQNDYARRRTDDAYALSAEAARCPAGLAESGLGVAGEARSPATNYR